jgi:hypothetical protein
VDTMHAIMPWTGEGVIVHRLLHLSHRPERSGVSAFEAWVLDSDRIS